MNSFVKESLHEANSRPRSPRISKHRRWPTVHAVSLTATAEDDLADRPDPDLAAARPAHMATAAALRSLRPERPIPVRDLSESDPQPAHEHSRPLQPGPLAAARRHLLERLRPGLGAGVDGVQPAVEVMAPHGAPGVHRHDRRRLRRYPRHHMKRYVSDRGRAAVLANLQLRRHYPGDVGRRCDRTDGVLEFLYGRAGGRFRLGVGWRRCFDAVCMAVGVVLGLAFVAARTFLVVESFISIRELPAAAYQVVTWLDVFGSLRSVVQQ